MYSLRQIPYVELKTKTSITNNKDKIDNIICLSSNYKTLHHHHLLNLRPPTQIHPLMFHIDLRPSLQTPP